jgi:hypothetical protein
MSGKSRNRSSTELLGENLKVIQMLWRSEYYGHINFLSCPSVNTAQNSKIHDEDTLVTNRHTNTIVFLINL